MFSRIRDNVQHLFDCFCEVAPPSSAGASTDAAAGPRILSKFPDSYQDESTLRMVPMFVFPCQVEITSVQHSSFVLTSLDSKWTFGFCRHSVGGGSALVLLSALPWHNTFFKLLNVLARHLTHSDSAEGRRLLWASLQRVYAAPVPERGGPLALELADGGLFSCLSTDHLCLPSIPHDRNLTEYFNAVDIHNMMVVFASMLYERRIVVTSRRLSRLSACVQAANTIIYPMSWQHIFIPILPATLIDYLSAPMPFLIGVPCELMQRVRTADLGDAVVLDADNNRITSPYTDLDSLPADVVSMLKRSLRNPNNLLGDRVARCFLRALVQLIGGYRDALRFPQNCSKITFDSELFVRSRPSHMQPFLEEMLQLQIFHQFISERLDMLNSGQGFSDQFELEACLQLQKSNTRLSRQYREWLGSVKKDGGALLKTFRNRTNPVLRSAVRNVVQSGKTGGNRVRMAYRDLRGRKRAGIETDEGDNSGVRAVASARFTGSRSYTGNHRTSMPPSRVLQYDLIDSADSLIANNNNIISEGRASMPVVERKQSLNMSPVSASSAPNAVDAMAKLNLSGNNHILFEDMNATLNDICRRVDGDLIQLENSDEESAVCDGNGEDIFDPLKCSNKPKVSSSSQSKLASVSALTNPIYPFYTPPGCKLSPTATDPDGYLMPNITHQPSPVRRSLSQDNLLDVASAPPVPMSRRAVAVRCDSIASSSSDASSLTHYPPPPRIQRKTPVARSRPRVATTGAQSGLPPTSGVAVCPSSALVPPRPVFRSVAAIRQQYENVTLGGAADTAVVQAPPLPPKSRQWIQFH